jgi:8-oxo-dGTP diphosphatase
MEIYLYDFQLFSIVEFSDRIEYTYWKRANLNIDDITLHEGQCLKWFTEEDIKITALAYGFNEILDDFFDQKPFLD